MELSSFKIVLIALSVVCLILVIELAVLFKKSPQSIPVIGKKLTFRIEVMSDLENFSVKLIDRGRLNEYIAKFGLFKKGGIKIRGASDYQTAKRLVIHLVESSGTDFFDEHMSKEGEVFAASKTQIIDDKFYLSVFLEPSFYKERGIEGFSKYFSVMTIRSLFLSSRHSQEMNPNERELRLKNLSIEVGGESSLFSVIKKK